ncbi:cytochrome P450 [Anabaena cylindrica PCC 7122]|nr:cytochrome P450 [Anabaena cylindrica PCC 7122]
MYRFLGTCNLKKLPHQRQGQLLAPPFHGERMRTYGQYIQEITQQVSDNWQIGKPFNIRESMQEITLRVILRVIFGLLYL